MHLQLVAFDLIIIPFGQLLFYKTLRQLEKNGCVNSTWEFDGTGPARRVYELTPRGEQHLREWTTVLDHISKAMARFVRAAQTGPAGAPGKATGRGRVRSPRGGAAK